MANTPNLYVIDETALTVTYNQAQTDTPSSMTSIRVGSLLLIGAATTAQEIVAVTATTGTTFTAYYQKAHLAAATVAAAPVATVQLSATTTANNSVAIANLQNIAVGCGLRFTSNVAETMIVASIVPATNTVTFTTNFTQTHTSGGAVVTDPGISATLGSAKSAPTVQPYLELTYARRIPEQPLQNAGLGTPILNADIKVRIEASSQETIIQNLAGTSGAASVAPLLTAFSGGNPRSAAALSRPEYVQRARVGDQILIVNPVTVTVGAGPYGYDEILRDV